MKKIFLTFIILTMFASCALATALKDYESGKKAFESKDYAAAVEYYNSAIKKNAKYADAYYSRGEAQMELDLYDEAIASFAKVISLKPSFADGYYGRGAA